MIRSELAELSAFATVAGERSFTRAASRLGISQSALSHSMRGLEKRFGIQLLARTTRSVSPTAAGTALLQELAPALDESSGPSRRPESKGKILQVEFGSSSLEQRPRW